MSEASVISNRFWRELKADIASTFSEEQRREIERVLGLPSSPAPASDDLGDLRMSFKWFFVRLIWGPEKRSVDRIKQEQATHPLLARRNLPTLLSLFTGYMAFWFAVMAVCILGFYYLLG